MIVKCGEVNRHQNPMQILADFQGKQFRYSRKDQDVIFSTFCGLAPFGMAVICPSRQKKTS